MANDIPGWLRPQFSRPLYSGWGKTPDKPQPGKQIQLGIEPGPARWEATMLPLDHSGDLAQVEDVKVCQSYFSRNGCLMTKELDVKCVLRTSRQVSHICRWIVVWQENFTNKMDPLWHSQHVCVCLCVTMPIHCTSTRFGFHARQIDGIECGLFSNHTPLGQTTLRVRRVSI